MIGDVPFAVLLPDVLIDSMGENNLTQMIAQFDAKGCSQIMVEDVAPERVDQYGIVKLAEESGVGSNHIVELVEKPAIGQAPSTLAVVGRYVFTPQIFKYLKETTADKSGEIQLTDAMAKLLNEQKIQSFTLQGDTFDCGSKIGYLKAVAHYALQRDELKDEFRQYLNSIISH